VNLWSDKLLKVKLLLDAHIIIIDAYFSLNCQFIISETFYPFILLILNLEGIRFFAATRLLARASELFGFLFVQHAFEFSIQ
jgi:hypothetical protein